MLLDQITRNHFGAGLSPQAAISGSGDIAAHRITDNRRSWR